MYVTKLLDDHDPISKLSEPEIKYITKFSNPYAYFWSLSDPIPKLDRHAGIGTWRSQTLKFVAYGFSVVNDAIRFLRIPLWYNMCFKEWHTAGPQWQEIDLPHVCLTIPPYHKLTRKWHLAFILQNILVKRFYTERDEWQISYLFSVVFCGRREVRYLPVPAIINILMRFPINQP